MKYALTLEEEQRLFTHPWFDSRDMHPSYRGWCVRCKTRRGNGLNDAGPKHHSIVLCRRCHHKWRNTPEWVDAPWRTAL